jgi:DNA polymerase (family 10)
LKLKGFTTKTQAKILEGIEFAKKHQGEHLFNEASAAAEELIEYLKEDQSVLRIELAGSLRRHKEIIKDIDIVVSSAHPARVMERFVRAPRLLKVTGHGETKSSIVVEPGIAADLRVVTDQEFPFALAHFTGSKEHNVVMRQRAKERGLKLNEYGLFREGGESLACASEEEIFKALDLPYIAPEMREDTGEFDAEQLPNLLEVRDLRGLIHCHTNWSDGVDTLETMVQRVKSCGYEYILVTDHSQTAAYAGGLKPDDVARQQAEIDALNARLKHFKVLKGIESDIRLDGSLDYEEDVLKTFDLIIASVHQKLEMTEEEATTRLIKAIENPYTNIIGHPTGRLLLQRPGYPINVDKILDACLANGVALEINANCKRLDLDWRSVRKGKDKGVKFCIGPDAHRVEGIDFVRFGVGIARKGWLEKDDVINTMTWKELLAWRDAKRP